MNMLSRKILKSKLSINHVMYCKMLLLPILYLRLCLIGFRHCISALMKLERKIDDKFQFMILHRNNTLERTINEYFTSYLPWLNFITIKISTWALWRRVKSHSVYVLNRFFYLKDISKWNDKCWYFSIKFKALKSFAYIKRPRSVF